MQPKATQRLSPGTAWLHLAPSGQVSLNFRFRGAEENDPASPALGSKWPGQLEFLLKGG